MRELLPACCLLLTACAAPADGEPNPARGHGIRVKATATRDGQAFGELKAEMWHERERRLELMGPEPADDRPRRGLELLLTGDFNRAGEFWGQVSVTEFERTANSMGPVYLGEPLQERLGPTTARFWNLTVPGRDGNYRLRIEMRYDVWTEMELASPRF